MMYLPSIFLLPQLLLLLLFADCCVSQVPTIAPTKTAEPTPTIRDWGHDWPDPMNMTGTPSVSPAPTVAPTTTTPTTTSSPTTTSPTTGVPTSSPPVKTTDMPTSGIPTRSPIKEEGTEAETGSGGTQTGGDSTGGGGDKNANPASKGTEDKSSSASSMALLFGRGVGHGLVMVILSTLVVLFFSGVHPN